MSLFARFFGKSGEDPAGDGSLVANPGIKSPLSLQLLFPDSCQVDVERLTRLFRDFHSSMTEVSCEFDAELNAEGKVFGMVGWGPHVVRCFGFNLPMPAEVVECCVAPSHYPMDLKEKARRHQAHVLLYYAGYETSPLEQYVALAATAAVFSRMGAIIVLNESGQTSFPAAALWIEDGCDDSMELLRALPLPILFCGFVKYEVIGISGVWMRTFGGPLLGLPDFLAQTAGHHEGGKFFEIFEKVFRYLLVSGAKLFAGHTLSIGSDEFLRLRDPSADERAGQKDGELFVMEIIGAEEINQ